MRERERERERERKGGRRDFGPRHNSSCDTIASILILSLHYSVMLRSALTLRSAQIYQN